jgi:hypothetical protein
MLKVRSTMIVAAVFAAMFVVPSFLRGGSDEQAEHRAVTMTVTAESRHKEPPIPVQIEDVQVRVQKEKIAVAAWKPASGPLNLYILIDEGLSPSADSFMGEIASFIRELPAQTRVAVGYASNGTLSVAQDFTEDREKAAKALRIPRGDAGVMPSPYLALNDVVKRFPDVPERREIVFLSSGYDALSGGELNNPYASTAIENAQRNNVQVFSVYAPSASHRGRHFISLGNAQSNLAKVADNTGGDSYFLGTLAPVSLKPYLDDILQAFAHQYLLRVELPAGRKSVSPKITTELPGVEFDYASEVWAPVTEKKK